MRRIEEVLTARFGYSDFKAGQRETIESVLAGQPTFGILPTGTGKSLCYQLPSYYYKGTTVVVSPLVSLMEDQVQQLKKQGEKAVIAINSQMTYQEKEWALERLYQFKFVFFSPETLMQPQVIQRLKAIKLALFVVDEAHCISQWGIDFRPEYEQISQVLSQLKVNGLLALTATATDQVVKDVEGKLFAERKPKIIRQSVNRPNIAYRVEHSVDKLDYIERFLNETEGSGIIYFASRKRAEEVSRELNQTTTKRVAFYHGEMSSQERSQIQQQFLANQLDVLCATSAFGMGVNKGDVDYIIHFHLPSSVEGYLQESGRGGRGNQQSLSIILYQPGDERIYYYLQEELVETSRQLADFKGQSITVIKENLPKLGELQEKWLTGYIEGRYTLEALEKALEEKGREKQRQLKEVLNYIQLTTCRRDFLLHYFSEDSRRSEQICCDNCGLYDKILRKSTANLQKNVSDNENWQEKLKFLFKM